MTRASNNDGSIRERKDGRFEGRYTAPDGSQRSVYASTRPDCRAKLKAAIRAIEGGTWYEPNRLTVGQWLDIWITDYCTHATGRTIETYKFVIEKRLKPAFGRIKLTDLSKIHVRHFMNDLQKQGLAPSTIQHAKGILSAAMKCAVNEADLIPVNPVTGVKAPRRPKPPFNVIDRAQFPAFIAEAQKNPVYGRAMLFSLLTGIRAGELRGLKWSDIDFSAGVMSIQRQLYAPSYARREFRQPKDGETRDIHLPQEALDILRAERKAQLERRVRLGADWQEDNISADLVFRREDGRSYNILEIYKATKAVGLALGFDNLHPHDLRHSYAVAALRSGIDVKTVQHNLGHKSATMTLDTYAAYTSDAGKTGAKKLSNYFSGFEN